MSDNLLDNVLNNIKSTDSTEDQIRRQLMAMECNRIMNENQQEEERREQRRAALAKGLAALLEDPTSVDYTSTEDEEDEDDEYLTGQALIEHNLKRLQRANADEVKTLNLHWETTPEEIARVEKALGHKI